MVEITQELMTPQETAEWFRRSPTWVREQKHLLRMRASGGQALYHVDVCRAYVLGTMRSLDEDGLRRVQIAALEASCKLHGDGRGGDESERRR